MRAISREMPALELPRRRFLIAGKAVFFGLRGRGEGRGLRRGKGGERGVEGEWARGIEGGAGGVGGKGQAIMGSSRRKYHMG